MSRDKWSVSSSKLKTYMECPAQYYWRYVAKKPDDKKSVSIKLPKNGGAPVSDTSLTKHDVRVEQEPSTIFDSGKIVHRVLELAAEKRIKNATCDKKVTKKELLGLLESVASEPPTVDWHRPLVINPETIESAAKVLALCWKSINFPFTIKTEHKFDESIGPIEDDMGNVVIEDAHVNGIIDRIDQLPNGRIKIVDYKSGWSVMSRAEAELDPQINLYLVVGKILFPKAEIDMELRYLNRGIRLGPIHYTESRKDWLLNGYVKPILARMATWGKYPETPGSPQCYSCPRKSECASFASMVKGTLGPVTADMGLNLALYERLGDIEGNIEQLKGQLKPFINSAVEKADDGEIFAGNHRARVVFRNSTAYHDLRGTAIAAAKAILEAKRATAPATSQAVDPIAVAADDLVLAAGVAADPVTADAGVDALRLAYAKLVEENAKLKTVAMKASAAFKDAGTKLTAENAKFKTIAMESATAFEVVSKIAKAQAGLVNDFVEGLPEAVTLQVAQAVEGTSTNAGYYMLEVERITIPFHDRVPNKAEIEEAAKQDENRKLIPTGSRPILDDSHENEIRVDAVVVDASVSIDSCVTKMTSTTLTIGSSSLGAQDNGSTLELFPENAAEKSVVEKVIPAAAWAQQECKACGGTGISSRGSPCNPCVTMSNRIATGV